MIFLSILIELPATVFLTVTVSCLCDFLTGYGDGNVS